LLLCAAVPSHPTTASPTGTASGCCWNKASDYSTRNRVGKATSGSGGLGLKRADNSFVQRRESITVTDEGYQRGTESAHDTAGACLVLLLTAPHISFRSAAPPPTSHTQPIPHTQPRKPHTRHRRSLSRPLSLVGTLFLVLPLFRSQTFCTVHHPQITHNHQPHTRHCHPRSRPTSLVCMLFLVPLLFCLHTAPPAHPRPHSFKRMHHHHTLSDNPPNRIPTRSCPHHELQSV
jgi:hypothetical protein